MNIKTSFIAMAAMLSMGVQAQTAQQVGMVKEQTGDKGLTLEDINFGGRNFHNMRVQNRWCTWWGNQLVRQDAEACFIVDKKSGKERRLFAINEVNQWAGPTKSRKVHSLYNAQFPYADKSIVVIREGHTIYTFDFKKKALLSERQIDGDILETCAASEAVAYLKDDNLYVQRGVKEWQLSADGSRNIVYGQSVHRDEFGIHKGTFWSPDGTRLAFYRMDQSMVTDYPQVNIPESTSTTPRPRAA